MVTHTHTQIIIDGNLDDLACIHFEFIDAIVYDFLKEHIDSIF